MAPPFFICLFIDIAPQNQSNYSTPVYRHRDSRQSFR